MKVPREEWFTSYQDHYGKSYMILNMKFVSIYFTLLSNFIMKDE